MSQTRRNHDEHWKSTIESLDLRGILLAGMAVFLAYFAVRQAIRPLPKFFVINPYLSAAAFAVVVSRLHLMSSIEPDMATWWDATIESAPRLLQKVDYALEGPWLFLLLALPFSCISAVTFGMAYAAWSALEVLYLSIGRKALRQAPSDSLRPGMALDVDRYYSVRIQHESCASALAVLIAGCLGFGIYQSRWIGLALLILMLGLITFIEVSRNPWFESNLHMEIT